ncbi:Polysaccharide deacetylase [Burkholderia sp. WP9]|uniref:polysaccharide deacetylase family protein n=1 Tax=Burkholderia sp. WP9 TaxID=1500263 RepID=UPI00089C6753|nr:polysaccharide deacetylase family protein [Burkholderia sp. WP9]SEC31624.1 Polysaccharide deacetylase [Burkholderia sp. WP9]
MTKFARAVPVLMYHHISTAPGMITVSPEHFAEQMAYLAAAGYTTVGSAQLSAYLAGEPLPKKSVVLTFDDGYLDNWVHAHPVLQAHGLTALCFLVTSWIGEGPVREHARSGGDVPALLNHHDGERAIENGEPDRAILRWSEIHAMREAGTFEFHSHTHSHVRWDQVSSHAEEKCAGLSADLASARAALEQKLGGVSDHLCWPQGYHDADYRRIAAQAGFRHFYTCEPGSNYSGRNDGTARSITRLEVRNKPASWLASRLWVHTRPTISRAYLKIKR